MPQRACPGSNSTRTNRSSSRCERGAQTLPQTVVLSRWCLRLGPHPLAAPCTHACQQHSRTGGLAPEPNPPLPPHTPAPPPPPPPPPTVTQPLSLQKHTPLEKQKKDKKNRLTLTTSSTVWQVGALRLISTAMTANSSTCARAGAEGSRATAASPHATDLRHQVHCVRLNTARVAVGSMWGAQGAHGAGAHWGAGTWR